MVVFSVDGTEGYGCTRWWPKEYLGEMGWKWGEDVGKMGGGIGAEVRNSLGCVMGSNNRRQRVPSGG